MGHLSSNWDLSNFRAKAGSFTTSYRPDLNRHAVRMMNLSNHYDESAARHRPQTTASGSGLPLATTSPEQTLRDGLDIAHRVCIEIIGETAAKEPCPNLVACSACGVPLHQRTEGTRRSTVGNTKTDWEGLVDKFMLPRKGIRTSDLCFSEHICIRAYARNVRVFS